MILTCPSCGTQYVVKDGAIPASGRQVRCKACQHSWREFPAALDGPLELDREAPEQTAPSEAEEPAAEAVDEPVDQSALAQEDEPAPEEAFEEASEPEPEPDPYSYDRDGQPEDTPPIPPETDVAGLAEAAPSHRLEWVEHDDDFTPFARRGPETFSCSSARRPDGMASRAPRLRRPRWATIGRSAGRRSRSATPSWRSC